MSRSNLTESSLKTFLNRAEHELNKGERVLVQFTDRLHRKYLTYQMDGMFSNLMCLKSHGSYYLARVR